MAQRPRSKEHWDAMIQAAAGAYDDVRNRQPIYSAFDADLKHRAMEAAIRAAMAKLQQLDTLLTSLKTQHSVLSQLRKAFLHSALNTNPILHP